MRRLLVPQPRPPWWVRLAFFAAGLAALVAVYVATGSAALQAVTMFVLLLGVLPVLERRFGVADDYQRIARDRDLPLRVWALSLAFVLPWGALTPVALGDAAGPRHGRPFGRSGTPPSPGSRWSRWR